MSLFLLKSLRLLCHQDWIGFGVHSRLLHLFFPPDGKTDHEFETDFYGFLYSGNLNSSIDRCVYFYGAYEKNSLYFLRDVAETLRQSGKKKIVFVDVGANVGQHSLYMSRYADVVHAFEPTLFTRQKLCEKINKNGLQNVHVHQIALGDADQLPVRIGDEYFEEAKICGVDLIRINVKGNGLFVLEGLGGRLAAHRPIICMKFSESTRRRCGGLQTLKDMLPHNYDILAIKGPFHRYDLRSFDFESHNGNIVLFPTEKSHLVPKKGR